MVERAEGFYPYGLWPYYPECLYVRACIRHPAQERKFPVWYRYHYRRILSGEDGPYRLEDTETEYKDSYGGRGNRRHRARSLGGSRPACPHIFIGRRPRGLWLRSGKRR